MIARNLNALRENFGELRKQVVETERQYKRGDKNLDTALFQTRNQLEATEKRLGDVEERLTQFIEEMTEVAFTSNLEIRGNTDRIKAIWETLEATAPDPAEIKRRREECEQREAARQQQIDRRLKDLADEHLPNGEASRAPRKAATSAAKRKNGR